MNRYFRIIIYITAAVACGFGNAGAEVLTGAHDPAVIRGDLGIYTLLTTNNMLQIRQSSDRVNWTVKGNIFSSMPAWVNTALGATIADIWAPHTVYRAGLYWVYYCASSFGTNHSVIGVATNPTMDTTSGAYHWTDLGLVIQSGAGNNYNAIDPNLFVDLTGNCWLAFGSFWDGIKMVAIDPATGKRPAGNTTVYSLASRGGGAIEGPTFIEHNGYYYLFSAWDTCCAGINSTYNTRVGRSANITGPYTDKAGTALMSSGGTQVLSTYGRYIGSGGGSAFKDGRRDYFTHHYYNGAENGTPRLHIREIVWDPQGWPILQQPYLGKREALEAEHAALTNAQILTGAGASNGEYAGNINYADSRVVFYLNALAAGPYELRVRYAAASGAASHFLTVNSNPEVEVLYPGTAAWGQFSETQSVIVNAVLNEGYNSLSFRMGTGLAQLDRVDILRKASDAVKGGSSDQEYMSAYQQADNSAAISQGGWGQYEYIDFGSGGFQSLSITFSNACLGPLKFVLDTLASSVSFTVNVNTTGPQTIIVPLPAQFISTSGVHDVFVQWNGTGTCGLGEFQFSMLPAGTPTATAIVSPQNTNTRTPSITITASPSLTVRATASPSYTPTATKTITPSNTMTYTLTIIRTYTRTATVTTTQSPGLTTSITASPNPSTSVTASMSPQSTFTITDTLTAAMSPSPTFSATAPVSPIITNTITPTSLVVPSVTGTKSPSSSPSMTASITASPSATASQSATANPSKTRTLSFTATSTPLLTRTITPSFTGTVLPSATWTQTIIPSATVTQTFTALPTPTIAWSDKFEIADALVFPNPRYSADDDLKIRINITRPATELKVRIYTVSFRLVMQSEGGAANTKQAIVTVPASRLNNLASGVYYAVVSGSSDNGDKAISKPREVIILR